MAYMAQSWYPPHGASLNQTWIKTVVPLDPQLPFERREALRGTIGSKSCDPQPPFERRGRRSKGGWVSQLFRPNGPTVLVLAYHDAHCWFWEALKWGWGSQLFGPMEPVDEKFWVGPHGAHFWFKLAPNGRYGAPHGAV